MNNITGSVKGWTDNGQAIEKDEELFVEQEKAHLNQEDVNEARALAEKLVSKLNQIQGATPRKHVSDGITLVEQAILGIDKLDS